MLVDFFRWVGAHRSRLVKVRSVRRERAALLGGPIVPHSAMREGRHRA
jgi:hypothetical protein